MKIEFKDLLKDKNIKTNYDEIPLIYEDNHILVVIKPAGIPSQKDKNNDISMIEIIKRYIKITKNKPGDVYLGLIHRLDTPTTGLMVFAKTSKAAERLSANMRKGNFSKKYLAILKGNILNLKGFKNKSKFEINTEYNLINYLRKDGKLNKSFVCRKEDKNAKKAELNFKVLKVNNSKNLSLVDVELITGRHHQIRAQFTHMGFPVYHDSKYDKKYNDNILRLIAYNLEFDHPTLKNKMEFNVFEEAMKFLEF